MMFRWRIAGDQRGPCPVEAPGRSGRPSRRRGPSAAPSVSSWTSREPCSRIPRIRNRWRSPPPRRPRSACGGGCRRGTPVPFVRRRPLPLPQQVSHGVDHLAGTLWVRGAGRAATSRTRPSRPPCPRRRRRRPRRPSAAGHRQLQKRLAASPEAAPSDSGPGPGPAAGGRGGGRGVDALPRRRRAEGRGGAWQAGAAAPGPWKYLRWTHKVRRRCPEVLLSRPGSASLNTQCARSLSSVHIRCMVTAVTLLPEQIHGTGAPVRTSLPKSRSCRFYPLPA